MAKPAVYDASAIQALKGLEPVRRMPGMYTHTVHPLHVVQEALDNAVDEALSGFGKRITVSVRKDGSVQVEDEGRVLHVTSPRPSQRFASSWRRCWTRSGSMATSTWSSATAPLPRPCMDPIWAC